MLTRNEQNQLILIVEDDNDTAEFVTALLETSGYSAVVADTGEIALSEIATRSPIWYCLT